MGGIILEYITKQQIVDIAIKEIRNLALKIANESLAESRNSFSLGFITEDEFEEDKKDLKEYPDRMVKLFKNKIGIE